MLAKLVSLFRQREELSTITVSTIEEHNTIYKRGVDLIKPEMILNGRHPKLTDKGRKNIRTGIRYLEAVTAFNSKNWNAYWIIGKGFQAMKEHPKAYQSFKKAYEIEDKNPNVLREYAVSCLQLGYGSEAVTVCIAAIEADLNDAGLHANLALAYLISGENSYAQKSIQYALEMNPEDQISQRLKQAINEVVNGKRAQPKTLSDLERLP